MNRLILCFLIMLSAASFSFTASAQVPPGENYEYYYEYGIYYLLNYDTGEAMVEIAMPDGIDYESMPNGSDSILNIKSEINGCRVTSIRETAFSDCQSLKTVYIPHTVVSIGDRAFINSSIEDLHQYSEWYDEGNISIGSNAFSGCYRLRRVVFGSPIAEVGEGAFNFCDSLRSVWFDPNSPVTTLSRGCFNCCTSLFSFDIPNNVTTIGDAAFGHCTSLSSVPMPNTVTSIGKYAFAECSSLNYISLSNRLETIDEAAFIFSGLISAYIPNTVTTLGDMAFAGCRNLTTAKLSDAITAIGKRAFTGCYALTSINIPNSVTTIGERAFAGCDFRGAYNTDYTDPHLGLLTEGTYEDYGSIATINIGSSLETVGKYAFVGHPLQSVTVMTPAPPVLTQGTAVSNPTVFDTNNFGTATLYVPRVLVNAYQAAEEWQKFTNIEGIEVLGNGDANGDGVVNISDAVAFISSLVDDDASQINLINADLNGDGETNISDIVLLISNLTSAPN